jgi:hypothetical protein
VDLLVIFLLSIVVTFVCCISELFFWSWYCKHKGECCGGGLRRRTWNSQWLKFSAVCDRFQCLPGALVTSNW